MDKLLTGELGELIKVMLFLNFILITAYGINLTLDVLKLRQEFLKIDFSNQFQAQRFVNSVIGKYIPNKKLKLFLMKALRDDCSREGYDHLVSKLEVAINEIKKKG